MFSIYRIVFLWIKHRPIFGLYQPHFTYPHFSSFIFHFYFPFYIFHFSFFDFPFFIFQFSFLIFHFLFPIFHFPFFIFHFSFLIFHFPFSIFHLPFFIYNFSFSILHFSFSIFHLSFVIFILSSGVCNIQRNILVSIHTLNNSCNYFSITFYYLCMVAYRMFFPTYLLFTLSRSVMYITSYQIHSLYSLYTSIGNHL